jgi:Flp pilus assembly protein TadG
MKKMAMFRYSQARGETLIEFALSFTLFLATVLGMMQFGIGVWQYNMLSNLAQEGARWASVRGSSSSFSASETGVQSFVRGRALGLSPTVNVYSASSSNVCSTTHVDPSMLDPGDGVCVNVTKTFAPLTRIVPMSTLTLSATAQMIIAR